jgi:imidazolonepropionase-like amidohydrolase
MLIKNAKRVYTMDANKFLEEVDVLVEDGLIKAIGKDLKVEDGVQVIDATGQLLYPGFIDAHCHLGLFEDAIGFEGMDVNEVTNPVTPELRGIDGINPMDRTFEEARQKGVTTVATGPGSANVIGGVFSAIKTIGNRIDDMIVKDAIGMKCAFGENPKRVYNSKNQTPVTRMAIASKLRETLFKAREYLNKKEQANEDVSKLPAFDMKLEALIPVLKKELPLKAHAHRADDIFTAIRIAKEFDVKLTLEHCTEGHLIADQLAAEGYPAIVGPSFGHRSKFELKNKTFLTPKVLQEAGVKIAIMTDSPVIPLDALNMCAQYAINAGMDAYEALKAITINPAEILEIEDRVGSIEVGKDADLVLWNGDALDISSKVLYTIMNGEIVYKAE